MKKTLIALLVVSCTIISAQGQDKKNCRPAAKHNAAAKAKSESSYSKFVNVASPFAENYRVCRSSCGYTICGEAPTAGNTAPASCARQMTGEDPETGVTTSTSDDQRVFSQNADPISTAKGKTVNSSKSTALQASKNSNAGKKKSPYNENYKVCKESCGYTICGEKPTSKNTVPKVCARVLADGDNTYAPSTSFGTSSAYAYNGRLYQNIKPVYDSTVNNANAPYDGKSSPQDDGPKKNNYRNMDANQSNLPPINGEIGSPGH